MATMYVYNIPTNETVNLRKTASSSGTVLVRVGYGKAVEASASTTAGWHNASYSGFSGYIMSQYLTTSNPNGGSGSYNYTITATVDTVKNGVGGTVNLRKEASTSSAVLTTVGNGQQILVATLTGEWLPAKYGSNAGFIMGKYIVGAEAYGSGSGGGTGNVAQQIADYSNANRGKPYHISTATYFANLEKYAAMRTVKYKSGGVTIENGEYTAMCCASYPYVCREKQGSSGCTTQYDDHMATSTLKGTISSLGGYDNLISGMEIFQGTSGTKEHMGVYYGKYDFGNGLEHAVYQSSSTRSTLKAKYEDSNKQGPNLTQMNSNWKYWGWPKYVVQ